MKKVSYKPIGIIHSKYKQKEGVPIQGVLSKDSKALVEIYPKYKIGLKDIEGFSHLILIYHFHLSKGYSLVTKPFLEDKEHGIFACRAPRRPNPIGISIVRLEKVEDNNIYIGESDMIDGTPLLDIKPFVSKFDARKNTRMGWIKNKINNRKKHFSDSRFD